MHKFLPISRLLAETMQKLEEHTDLTLRSAGRLMIAKIPTIHPNATISDAETWLLKKAKELETINYIYVTGAERKLEGVISIKEVFRSPKNTLVSDLMKKNPIAARPHTDQTRVALLAIENNLKEIPVVDAENKLLGVVPYDAILNVLIQGHVEEALGAAGISKFSAPAQSIIKASAGTVIKKRLPWLVIGVLGSIVAAGIIGYFQSALEERLLLALFIPAIAYIAGAVGTQSETIFVRSIALDKNFNFGRYLRREALISLGLAVPLGALAALAAFFFWQAPDISIILAITIFISVFISMMVAVLQPWIFAKAKIDPAVIGGPLDTIVSDISSILIYFLVATMLFNLFYK